MERFSNLFPVDQDPATTCSPCPAPIHWSGTDEALNCPIRSPRSTLESMEHLIIGADNLHRGPVKSFFQYFTGIEHRERFDRPGHQSRPARLMAGADAGAVVAVEILVEKNQITPVRIVLELCGGAVDGPPSALVAQENIGKTAGDLIRHFPQRHQPAGP